MRLDYVGSKLDRVVGWRPVATKGEANGDGERVRFRGPFGAKRKLIILVAGLVSGLNANLAAIFVVIAVLLWERHARPGGDHVPVEVVPRACAS